MSEVVEVQDAQATDVVVVSQDQTIVVPNDNITLVTEGLQGPPGPAGTAGEAVDVTGYTAGQALSGHRAVYVSAGALFYADSATAAHAPKVLGVTQNAAAMGGFVSVRTNGLLVEPTWAFAPGFVFLGANGVLTQTPPSTGFLLTIGVAVEATVLYVQVGEPVLRS